jgi:triacylglycerol esterase/lipase EstA (alpha/beta hydrolase family)
METKRFIVATALILSSFVLAQAQTARPLMLNETSYRLRAGEVAEIAAPSETLEFVSNATIRRVESAGKEVRGIVVGPSRAGDKLRLGVSVLMKPGEYALTLRAIGKTGEIRETPLKVTVDAIKPVPSDATQPPVILLNGFQGPFGCTPEPSSDTFGNLETYLQSDNISTYWFDNCAVCPGCAIEELGNDLAATIALATSGMTVPQVDLIAHSMGGLIIRSYLSGKQTTSGVFFPPLNPEVRKAIFIATPHFGSYLANLADWFNGVQAAEMTPGSQFVIDLAKWNQFQDDLRGVDALAAIGNAGPDNNVAQTSDGVVSLTSASLKLTSATLTYAEPDVRTRIVEYCHITFNTAEALVTGCYFPGIAYIDTTLHPTYQIIQSFLANTTAWEDTTVSTTPSMDPYLSAYGSVIIGEKTANDQWVTDLNSIIVSNANLNFAAGPSNPLASLFFNEWVPAGSYDLTMYNSTNDYLTGVLTTIAGGGMAIFFKPDTSPIIHSVQSEFISSLAGLSVASGSNITISGPLGDGPYQIFANGTPISISSSSSQQIVAYLPASFIGLVPIEILTNTGQNTINIMAGPPAVYTISGQATLSGSGLSGVTMTLSGSQGGSTTTDGSGNYSFTVPAGGNYTVTPSLAGYIFYLPSLSFNNLSSSQGGANFTALAQSINPAPGTVLSDSLADFSWSAVSGATQYQLTVGTTPGGTNIFSGATAGTSQTVGSIPCTDTVGGTIYVQLAAEVNGSFQPAADYTYKCKSGIGDFNGDGYQDVVWQNNSTHQVTVHYYDGTEGVTYIGWNWLNESGEPSGWVLVGAADFDGNGVPDLVWEYMPTGQVTVNYYGGPGGATYLGWNWLISNGNPGWTVVAVADMDGNGVPDLIWQNNTTNQVTVNYFGGAGGAVYQGWNWLNSAGEPAGWHVVAAADFDGNGTPDLVWQYAPTRQVTVNYYGGAGGATYQGWNWLNSAGDPGWTVVGASDFNGLFAVWCGLREGNGGDAGGT